LLHHTRSISNDLSDGRRTIPWIDTNPRVLSFAVALGGQSRLSSEIVEHLLNLLWLVVATVFFVGTVVGRSRGILRCSLPVALGCTALLVLILFPALSMTDDLQRAKLAAETNGRGDVVLLLRAMEDGLDRQVVLFPMILLLLLIASRLLAAGRLLRHSDVPLFQRLHRVRPDAVRPPPAFLVQQFV
jgi:hypothetical protein